jgi:DNA-binding transcriptional ArsR family regulator
MSDPHPSDSPLRAVAAGEHATEAFERLSDETRLAILVALWERYEPFDASDPVRFSELRDRVGTPDSGRFSYHLDRLEGHFVESVDGGYRLSEAGLVFVRSVIAGAGIDDPTLEPSEVDQACPLCGASVEVAYEDGWVHVRCTECEGLWGDGGDDGRDGPDGQLAMFSLHPAGLVGRTPAELYAAAWVTTFQKLYSMIEGVCPTCTGRVERSLEVCDDHDPDGGCANCGRRTRTVGRLHCPVCKEWVQTTIGGVAKYHPRVVGFCYDHGLELQYGFNDLADIRERLARAGSAVDVLSVDPPRVRVTTELDGEECWVVLDRDLTAVDADG